MVSAGPNLDQAAPHLVAGRPNTPSMTLELATPRGEKAVRLYVASRQKSMSPPVLLDGNALQELGYSPGPLFSKMMAALEEEQLMERVQSKEEAVKFVEDNFLKG